MTLVCPGCGRRYRLDDDRVGTAPRKVRCSGCGKVFQPGESAPERPDTGVRPPSAAPQSTSAAPSRPSARPSDPPLVGGAPLALVADEDREFRALVARTLESLGFRVETTDDGETAFRFAIARKPAVMVVNVYLRRLLGVAVCEGVKGSPDLRATKVALVGSVFKSDRFVRGPGTLYGADDYFEDVIPRDELRARLGRLLQRRANDRRAAAPDSSRGGTQGSQVSGKGPSRAPGVEDDEGSGQALAAGFDAAFDQIGTGLPGIAPDDPILAPVDPREEIRRLARIMLSDLRIYHPDNFHRAVVERRFFETFREEMTKGKELIALRFPELPERIEVLAAALREGLEEERRNPDAVPAGAGG